MEEYFNRFNNVFHGIIAGPLLVFVILFLQFDKGRMTAPFADYDFVVYSALAFLASVFYFLWVFSRIKKERKNLVGKFNLQERLILYRTLSTKFYVLMTLSGIFSIVAIFLTGELTFGFIYMVQLFLLSIYRPSVHNICKYLDLKGEERQIVLKKKDFENP
ncbi:MAG: hypothetical protein KJO50_06025 [Bacteroidia bacterium]|nr:hypothetical protein [Bacteroidia bacterium]